MRISTVMKLLWLCYFLFNSRTVGTRSNVTEIEEQLDGNGDGQAITIFTVASTHTGVLWRGLPYREKFQWQSEDAPCRRFKLKVPDERSKHDQIELCIYRPQLEYSNDLDTFVNSLDAHDDEQREMKVQGVVKGKDKSVVSGRMIDKFFYGEVSYFDKERNHMLVYVVEEIGLLKQLLRRDKKVLHSLLYVMNKGEKSTVPFNAVVTQGVSLLSFIANDQSDDDRSFIMFSTSCNSYISPGEAEMKVDELGRLNIASPKDSITINDDGSVLLSTKHREYKFRPNGQTIVTKGQKVETLHEHEGPLAVIAFTSSITYDCVLPPPSFRKNRKGGYLCRVCLLTDKSFEQYYTGVNQSVATTLNNVIDRVSWIFRAVDWNKDTVPDNIGLEYDSQIDYRHWDPQTIDKEYMTKDDLDVIYTELSQMDFSECCLAIAYTMTAFPESIYAKSSLVSQTLPGGICAVRNQGLSNNVILISANNKEGDYGPLTDEQLTYLTAHEIGKAFGAPLDATGKESCDNFLDEQKVTRHYIMWPDVLRNLTEEEKKFSGCTISVVHNALRGCRTACFESNHHPFCGNGLIEEGEECDCGSAYNCSKQLCCYARSGKYPCRKTGVPCPSSSGDLRMSSKILRFITSSFLMLILTKNMSYFAVMCSTWI